MADKGTAKRLRETVDEEHDPGSLAEKTRGFRHLATTKYSRHYAERGDKPVFPVSWT